MNIIRSPWHQRFREQYGRTTTSIDIASPFVSSTVLNELLDFASHHTPELPIRLLTRMNGADFAEGVAQLEPFERMAGNLKVISNLHAKIYLLDNVEAIVTSANLTFGGLSRNEELGVAIQEPQYVQEVKGIFDAWWTKAVPIDLTELRDLVRSLQNLEPQPSAETDKQRQKLVRKISRLGVPVRSHPTPETDEAQAILEEEDKALLQAVPFPQANDLDKIARVPLLVHNGITRTSALARQMGVVGRQGDYYANAALALRLVAKVGPDYVLTPLGNRYVLALPHDRLAILRQAVIDSPVMRAIANELNVDLGTLALNPEHTAPLRSVQSVANAIRKLSHEGLVKISSSTVERRAQNITSWIRWLEKQKG